MSATDCSDATSQFTAIAWRLEDSTSYTVLGEPLRESLSDAVGGAGDDGDFVFVALCHCDVLLNKRAVLIAGSFNFDNAAKQIKELSRI
jgi:hypothetical protein